MNRHQILIVDDDPAIRTLLRLVAERRGLSADVAADGAEALQLLAEKQYRLAIIDLMMPRVNGYELVTALRTFEQRPAVIIATAMTDSLIGLLDAETVHTIIRKPFDIEIVGSLMTAIAAESQPAETQPDAPFESVEPPLSEFAC
ncbi:MAG: response regulator [Acidobacteriota bacterium]|nr:response regulator [Acidobacteriota bacterium]